MTPNKHSNHNLYLQRPSKSKKINADVGNIFVTFTWFETVFSALKHQKGLINLSCFLQQKHTAPILKVSKLKKKKKVLLLRCLQRKDHSVKNIMLTAHSNGVSQVVLVDTFYFRGKESVLHYPE